MYNDSKTTTIKLKKSQKTAWIILNRPEKLNAINIHMLEKFSETIDQLEKDTDVRSIIIKGEGERAFSTGADLTEIQKLKPNNAHEFSLKGQKTFSKLEKLPKPVIAAIGGYALGGGLELALTCDFRIAVDHAELGFPEIKMGFIPAWGGTQRLPLIIGLAHAKRLIMLGDRIQADEAYRIGLVDKVVPLEKLEEEAEALAQRLNEYNPAAIQYAKSVSNSVIKVSAEGLKRETEAFTQLLFEKETIHKIHSFRSQKNNQ